MKKIITLILLTGALHLNAATVRFSLADFTGGPNNRAIIIALRSQTGQSGTNIVTGTPRTIQPTNGVATVSLLSAVYTVQIDGINKLFYMPVPDTTNTYNALDLVNQGISMDAPYPAFAAGTNILILTNWVAGKPVLTISSQATNSQGLSTEEVQAIAQGYQTELIDDLGTASWVSTNNWIPTNAGTAWDLQVSGTLQGIDAGTGFGDPLTIRAGSGDDGGELHLTGGSGAGGNGGNVIISGGTGGASNGQVTIGNVTFTGTATFDSAPSGSGASLTDLDGANIQDGSIESNTFTPETLALLGGSTNFFGSNVIASIVASTNSFTLDAAGVALTEEQTYHWNADLDRYTNSVNESVVVWESDSEYWCVTNQFSVPDIISIPFTYLAESGIEAYWLDTNVQQSTLIGSFTSDTNLHLVAYADDYRGAFPVPSSEAFINVKMPPFSAAGDGVTDDAPAIQSALEYAASGDTETSEVYLPEGDYRLLSTITLPSNTDITNRNTSYTRKITLRGQGSSSRMLWYQTNGNAIEFIKLVGANKTNALFQVTFADFALWGPLQWGLAHPAGQVFNYTFASNVTARGFAVGNTDPSGPGAVSAVAVGWTWKNVLVSGFYDGMTITNADYTLIDKPMVESFSHCGIIFAGSTEPRIHGGGVGTVSIFGCSWTNDFAGIVFVKDVHGFPCYNPMVDNVEGGYQSRLIYRRECGTLTVNACASDSIHFAFIDTDAAQMFAYNSWCAGAPFIYTPTSLYASYYSFPWTFVNCTTTEGYPFIVNGSGVTAFSSMPNIFRNSGPEETLTYNPFGNPALKTAWKTNMLMQCGTNYYYLPRVGQALSADTDTLMGRELYVITNGLPIYTASNFVTFGSLALPARTARAWGVSIGDDAGIQYYYPLKRFLASDQLTVRVALALYTGYQPQTNGGRIAYSFNVRGMTSTNSVQNTAVTGYITLTTNTIATNLTVRLNTLAGAAPFYNWNTEARFLWVYLHGLTNDISISDVSVTYNEPFTPPPVSTGFRLPDGP